MPNPKVSLECPTPVPSKNQESVFESLCLCLSILFVFFLFKEHQGGDVRSRFMFAAATPKS